MAGPPRGPIVDLKPGKQTGFSLIELMITMVIFIMLTLAAVSLGSGWLVSSDLQKSESTLKMAHARAKTLAIRNANGNAAGMQITGQKIFICEGAISMGCNQDNATWSGSFAKRSTVKINNGTTSVQLDHTGLAPSTLQYTITEGGDQVEGSLV